MRGASHTLTVRSKTSPSVNTEGQVSYTDSDTTVRGRVMVRNDEDLGLDGQASSQAEAIAWLPVTTTITDADQIVVSGLNSLLNGTYDITGIQHTPSHYRVFLLGART